MGEEQTSSTHNSIPTPTFCNIFGGIFTTQNTKAKLGLNLHPRNCSFVGGSACNQFREPLKIKTMKSLKLSLLLLPISVLAGSRAGKAERYSFVRQHPHVIRSSANLSKYEPLKIRGGDKDDIIPESLRELVDETVAADRKIIVVTGGVLSGIGKGVTASSLGVLLRAMGLRVTALKIDPYLNVDAGTMSPFEHGEVFVLDDGGETDLDLGNYERFLSVSLTKESNLSTGKIYQSVIDRERMGDYLGKTVQVVPHISGKRE